VLTTLLDAAIPALIATVTGQLAQAGLGQLLDLGRVHSRAVIPRCHWCCQLVLSLAVSLNGFDMPCDTYSCRSDGYGVGV